MKILNRYDGCVIFEGEYATIRLAAEAAVKSRADLSRADLSGADLSGANLYGADLYGADLSGANLSGARLEDSTWIGTETWGEYKRDVVPALLTAGGKTLRQIVDAGSWECHAWTNCPMAEAFGVRDPKDIPALYRPRATQFISFFDAHMIPKSVIEEAIARGAA